MDDDADKSIGYCTRMTAKVGRLSFRGYFLRKTRFFEQLLACLIHRASLGRGVESNSWNPIA
jgi:hypothetical protein